jgi:magnesium chelatase subunit H
MQKPISDGSTPPVRVVIITLDSHLAQAAERAQLSVRQDLPNLELVVHPADEWGSDDAALARCLADIAQGDIVIATMLFLDDHIRAVMPALVARREQCDAMVCCMSATEIVKLTRLGKFDMAVEASGPLALLKRLRGKNTGPKSSGQSQMKMLRQLPRLLRFIPGTAQDVRAYFQVMQYWLAGSSDNIAGMLRLLVNRYAAGPRAGVAGTLKVTAPIEYPDIGLYHPAAPGRIVEQLDQLPSGQPTNGTVGVLVLRAYLLANNAAHYDGVIAALEAKGMRVITAFASGLDSRPAIDRYFLKDGVPTIDALVSLTGFSLVGGPAYNNAAAAEEVLAKLDVPYILGHPLEFQTIEQWQTDPRGLTPIEATMMVAIPELDGAIMPITFGGRSSAGPHDRRAEMTVNAERAAMLAARVAKLIALRRSERAERKIAIVLFNFPPNAGNNGTAAFLSVFESLHNTLSAMRDAGYTVDVPGTVDELRGKVVDGNALRYGASANVVARVSADDHVRRERWLAEIEKQWGPAPGRVQTDGSGIFVLGERFGNVFVGIQPGFGYEGDPMRLLFERGFAPTHAFSAFYRWIRESFGAHAVLHFGTHGALEFMPGKQAGMSGDCWPDRLISDLPNFYLYASNNPSEGTIAKRRSGATLISYLTPPVAHAGLYAGLADLKASIDRWRALEPDADGDTRALLAELIQSQAVAVDLAAVGEAWAGAAEARIHRLSQDLLELEYALIPEGLHVVGKTLTEAQRAEILDLAGITEPERRAELDLLLATDGEIPGIIHALDGGFMRPAPGGDLLRSPEVLPTGRNLHGFDPFRIPTVFAVQDGARQADRLIARHRADQGANPESIAMVLWGSDNIKSEGGPIAQALWLLGAAPRRDSYGRVCGAELIPLEVLGRARIDVVVTLSGIFRDLLPLQTRLLAEAALLAATADEPIEQNFIRKHALAFQAENGGSMEQAALRVFGNADGAYGSNVNLLIDEGGWDDEAELGDSYLRRKGFAYGVDARPQQQAGVLKHMLSSVDATYQNLESVEVGITNLDQYFDTLGGVSQAVKQARGSAASVYIGDQTRGEGTIRTLSEQVSMEVRTRALNPKYYEALLAHGYEGVREIQSQVTNTLGWSATTGEVAPWVYHQLSETFVLDDVMRERMGKLNPTAAAKIANRLLEANERNYWSPDPDVLERLRRAGQELEDRLEGIEVGAAA